MDRVCRTPSVNVIIDGAEKTVKELQWRRSESDSGCYVAESGDVDASRTKDAPQCLLRRRDPHVHTETAYGRNLWNL